jgi:hypothetical protein
MPEAEGGPYQRSEELSPSESGAFDDEPESADVPQANDDALEKPGTMTQDLARSPGTPELLTLIHLISIPVTNTSVNSARSTRPVTLADGWAVEQSVAVLAGAHSGRDSRRALQVDGGGIAGSLDSAATASDLAEASRG